MLLKPIVVSRPPSLPALSKMEDRKRPVSGSDDMAPPSKRQAVTANKSREDTENKEDAWIEEFQKDAIYRQMLEYKREKSTLEMRLNELELKSAHHDDHLRLIDAWWLQLVQEISQLAGEKIPFQPDLEASPFLSALDFKDNAAFQEHLAEKSSAIKSTLDDLFTLLSNARGKIDPQLSELEGRVNSLLATQKEFMVKLDMYSTEKEQLSQDLNIATLRYFKAERKLDRTKSTQVQKLEQQALAQSTGRATQVNGVGSADSRGPDEDTQLLYHETKAVCSKQREQIAELESQNKSLRIEVAGLQHRLRNLSDEDYARSEVFKCFKNQYDELVRRINTLEACNQQSKEEAERLRAERTAYQAQLDTDTNAMISEYEEQLRMRDSDITRIRSSRDDMYAELQMKKQQDDQERVAREQLMELVSAKQDRIAALETQIAEKKADENGKPADPDDDPGTWPIEKLRERVPKMQQELCVANEELQQMESAYKKTWALAHNKTLDFASLEAKVSAARESQTKAEHRSFAVRKDLETRMLELKALRMQHSKSSEVISQLKETDGLRQATVQALEKQLHDMKLSNAAMVNEARNLEAQTAEAHRKIDAYKAQITELAAQVKEKEIAAAEASQRQRSMELDLERTGERLAHIQKDRDGWKSKCLSNSSEEEQMLRQFSLCTICRANFKNTFIRTCGHLFCKQCVDDRIANRMRKCPTCSKPFDKFDAVPAHF